MRRSELLALRWSDVDLDFATISVSRTLHRLRDKSIIFRQTKTAKARRMIALTPSAVHMLREHKKAQEGIRILSETTLEPDDLIFSSHEGEPLQPDTVTHAWIKLVRRNGLKGIRFHDNRHSHASLLLKEGIHPKVVQERLGHASIQTTLDTYSHVAPGLQQAAAERLDQRLNSASVKLEKVASEKTE